MGLPQIIARNQTQKIVTSTVNGRVVIQPNTWYTCPTAKKAVLKGRAVCTGTGAGANSTLSGAGVAIRRCLASGGSTLSSDQDLAPDVGFDFEVQLDAGETLISTQDSGTNAEWNVIANVQETPA